MNVVSVCLFVLNIQQRLLQDRYLGYLSYGSMIYEYTFLVLCD